jgi:hypothetical protein
LGFFDIFRRPPAIQTLADIADFIDRQAAFLVQKGIYEYSRARAGHYAKVLFGEPTFRQAVEESRWRAYPLGLAMLAETVEGTARPHSEADGQREFETLSAVVLSIFDRYPVPDSLGPDVWEQARAELERRLQLMRLHPPKRVIDIPEQFVKTYFDLMPIHEKLRGRDFPTTRNYLRIALCNIHGELTKRVDPPVLAEILRAPAGEGIVSNR